MRTNTLFIAASLIAITLSSQIVLADTSASASVKCPALVQAANKAAVKQRSVGNKAAEQIDSGEPLKNQTCLDALGDFQFDFFSGIPSLTGAALKAAKDRAIEAIKSMSCEAANQAIAAGKKLLTCNAALGLQLDASAGFDSINVQECGGLDLEADIDGGSYNVGNGDQVGVDVDRSAGGSIKNNASGAATTNSNNKSTESSWSNWFNK